MIKLKTILKEIEIKPYKEYIIYDVDAPEGEYFFKGNEKEAKQWFWDQFATEGEFFGLRIEEIK